jgi:fructose/tagatose bisphosphate aldolase
VSRKMLDEFDEKAKKFLEEERFDKVRDVLREYALDQAYKYDEELRDPLRFLKTSGIDVENIRDFTEYRVAKSVIQTEIKRQFGSKIFDRLKKKVNGK